ncbi:MAG TPA: hypothetical protein VFE51_23980 [Verrucomicrobiae bacterium]|nr:hypothetical protein [Verrucomicrobiae bacterium]
MDPSTLHARHAKQQKLRSRQRRAPGNSTTHRRGADSNLVELQTLRNPNIRPWLSSWEREGYPAVMSTLVVLQIELHAISSLLLSHIL